jgi:hypothetical protein
MAYIGKQPVVGNFVKLDTIVTSATATYNLLNGGVAYYPQTANNCIVSLNGVIQSPTSAYTISGSTIVFDSALTSSDTIDFILVLGDVLAIGTPSDGTVTSAKLASGTTGLIAWQSVQTTGFTASAGRGYPCNTTSAAFTVTLPASPSAGDTIILLDYAGTFATNNITLGRNSNKIEGGTNNKLLTTNREAVTLVYVDSTQGWVASSGTNFGSQSLDPIIYSADFLVIAGGAGGGQNHGGGAGAGGYRSSNATYGSSGGGGSAESNLTFNGGIVYTITVGAGGGNQTNGSNSLISGSNITTITSTGGGTGGTFTQTGFSGGSGGGGGGGSSAQSGGSGTANQGYSGGTSASYASVAGNAAGGGGASGVGGNATIPSGPGSGTSGSGGNGVASTITGSSTTRGGGGSGGRWGSGTIGTAGTGGGGPGGNGGGSPYATDGTANTGGGGGGGGDNSGSGGNGGSGVVILRMPTANYSGTTTGSPTVSTSGADTILVYNASGTYTG